MKLTVALDIDGVISPITPMNSGAPENAYDGWEYTVLSGNALGIAIGKPVLDLMARLSTEAKLYWHSSWREMANDAINSELGFDAFPLFASEEVFQTSSDSWWKLVAVENWLDANEGTDAHLLWLDDDILDSHLALEIPDRVLDSPQISLVSPRAYWGISPRDIAHIEKLLDEGARIPFASNPQDPTPLPSTPGSAIVYPSEDLDAGYVKTAVLDYEGKIVWIDSFGLDGGGAVLPSELDETRWVQLLRTVEADKAAPVIQKLADEGDVLLGAVFRSDLPDSPGVFTTSAGYRTRSRLDGEVLGDVLSSDVYGNLPTDSAREYLFLPESEADLW